MPDAAEFLAAIREHPDDDGPRLVYADWLEANAGLMPCPSCEAILLPDRGGLWPCRSCGAEEWSKHGWVPNGYGQRAEFIRVQCELATMEPDAPANCRPEWLNLCRREQQLFADPARTLAWFDLPQPWASIARLDRFDHEPADYPYAIVSRGFVESVVLSWADWGGAACQRCPGRNWGSVAAPDWEVWPRLNCSACNGTGRTPGHAAAIVAATPLRKVRLTTRPPLCARREGQPNRWWIAGLDKPKLFSDGDVLLDGNEFIKPLLAQEWPGIEFELPPRVSARYSHSFRAIAGERLEDGQLVSLTPEGRAVRTRARSLLRRQPPPG